MIAQRLVCTGAEQCSVEEFCVSHPLEAGSVLVTNRVSLVSPGTELAMFKMTHRGFTVRSPETSWVKYPFYPGYPTVGEVAAVGTGVTALAVGDRVWRAGSHASASVVVASAARKIPHGIADDDAVFFGLVKIAMTAIRRAPVELGEQVLISGLGLVGMLSALIYQCAGATVGAADFSAGRLLRVRMLGIDPVINLGGTSLVEWSAAPDRRRPDVSVEAFGVEASLDAYLEATGFGGRVVLLGSPRQVMEIDPYTDIHRKGLTVIGAHVDTVTLAVREKDVKTVFTVCGALQLDSLRTHTWAFDNAPELYHHLHRDLDDYLAVLLTY